MTDVTLIYKVRDYESTNTQNTEISNEKLFFGKKLCFLGVKLQVTQISVATDYVMTPILARIFITSHLSM